MTAPGSGRDDATLRGAVVLVVAIVIGLALLARTGGGGDEEQAGTDQTSESTTTTVAAGGDETTVPIQGPTTTTTTTPTGDTQDPASVLVVVLNATETVGWAGDNAALLASAGYTTDEGNVAGENVDTTTIYATPEAQADAQAVASVLDLGGAPVTQKPEEPLGSNGQDAEADVVVVLGADSVTG